MSTDKEPTVKDLMKKGDGVLIKRGHVWTYPGCANDASGTNLVMPIEYVSDAEVQKALAGGELRAAITNPSGGVSAVRLIDDGTAVMTSGMAGTAEMGTELPPNSRVTSDAGAGVITAAEAEQQVHDAVAAMKVEAAPAPASKPSKAKS